MTPDEEIRVKGITVPFPDEMEDALLNLRAVGTQWAFDVGRITDEAIRAALDALQKAGMVEIDEEEVVSGIVGKIVAHVGRLVGRSSSRVRRYLDLHRAFGEGGSTGVYWKSYKAPALNHWETALGLRDDPELLAEYLDTVEDYPTEKPAWCLEQAKINLGREDVPLPSPAADAVVQEIVEAIAEGREPAVEEEDMQAVMRDESSRTVVVNTLLKAVNMIDAALPVLKAMPDVAPVQIEAAEGAIMQLQALLTTLVATV